jgi:hypothetical protein
MNLFAILYCFPPLLVPATMCYVKLLVGLRERGYEIDVLTIDPDSFSPPDASFITDETLMQLIPDGIVNHQIWSWENNRLIKFLKQPRISNNLFYRWFQPRKREWTFSAINYLKKIDLNKYDVVLSCSQPHCNHLIGYHLKRKTGKRWIAYFSDPWTDMPWEAYHSKKIADYNLRLEREVISEADFVIFTSKETSDLVMKKYPKEFRNKCGVLTHCFVPEWYDITKSTLRSYQHDERIKIIHTGHFYGYRTPMPFFRILSKLNRESNLADKMQFLFYGNMDNTYKQFVQERGLDNLIKINSAVPYLESLSMMTNADCLLLIDAPLRLLSESIFLPSKLIDYLGSYTPVIGITPEKGTSARVIRETGNLFCDVEKENDIYIFIENILKQASQIKPLRDAINMYHYKHTAKICDEIIKRIT